MLLKLNNELDEKDFLPLLNLLFRVFKTGKATAKLSHHKFLSVFNKLHN